jgi:DNA-binding transcriptional MerR regulator
MDIEHDEDPVLPFDGDGEDDERPRRFVYDEDALLEGSSVRSLTNLSTRTIYYYVQRGLIPKAVGYGPSARWTSGHVVRLLVIAELKGSGRTLHQIRAFMDAHTLDELIAFAEGEESWRAMHRLMRFIDRHKPPRESERVTRIDLLEGIDLYVSREHLPRAAARFKAVKKAIEDILEIEDPY